MTLNKVAPRNDSAVLVYELYGLTENEIAIVGKNEIK